MFLNNLKISEKNLPGNCWKKKYLRIFLRNCRRNFLKDCWIFLKLRNSEGFVREWPGESRHSWRNYSLRNNAWEISGEIVRGIPEGIPQKLMEKLLGTLLKRIAEEFINFHTGTISEEIVKPVSKKNWLRSSLRIARNIPDGNSVEFFRGFSKMILK